MPTEHTRLVYSTDGGRVREPRGTNATADRTREGAPPPPDDGIVRIRREKKRGGGRVVTSITGLPGTAAELDGLLKMLKEQCGAGGTRAGTILVLQGDHRERLRAELESLGHRVIFAGR